MVIKERNPNEHADRGPTGEAGAGAERQMAFYLRREFGESLKVLILNDLRVIDENGDSAQIDHLVIQPYGLVIVESKSICGSVEINEHGEWCRLKQRGREGMQSPIAQAILQAKLLRKVIREAFGSEATTGVARTPRVALDPIPFWVLVAVSDRGVIERRSPAPEVCKADAVPSKIRAIIAAGHPATKVLDRNARQRIADFLVTRHTPRRASTQVPRATSARSPSPVIRPLSDNGVPTCRFCGSRALHAQYGKFGYYFRCLGCTRNTPIDKSCPACGTVAKVRKDKLKFFKDCGACGRVSLFYVNASLTDLEDPHAE